MAPGGPRVLLATKLLGSFCMLMSQDFKLILDRTKGYKTDDGRPFVNGIASSTNPGLTGE
jgi:hypothetical protein